MLNNQRVHLVTKVFVHLKVRPIWIHRYWLLLELIKTHVSYKTNTHVSSFKKNNNNNNNNSCWDSLLPFLLGCLAILNSIGTFNKGVPIWGDRFVICIPSVCW